MLKADVWRDVLIREQTSLNAKLEELEKEGDDKRFVDAREEASARLAEVHASLAEMEAESGPARAASLLAGRKGGDRILFAQSEGVFQVLGSAKRISSGRQGLSVVVGGQY